MGTVSSRIFLKFILDIALIYVLLTVSWGWWIIVPLQFLYVFHKFRLMFSSHIDAQITTHLGLYVSWITTMAFLRDSSQSDVVVYITESLVETISGDKGYCKGNLYAAFWYIGLLVCYVTHVIHLYWTFSHTKQIIGEVKKFGSLPPRVSFVK